MSHLNTNDILLVNQHGFRADHSCATQLITLTEDILHALDHQASYCLILQKLSTQFCTRDFLQSYNAVVIKITSSTGLKHS